MIEIKLPDLNDFVVTATLDKNLYRLHMSWNDVAGWTLGIRDGNDVALLYGVRCVPNYPLIHRYRRPALPKGEFICVLLDEKQEKIGRGDFASGKAAMVYMAAGELYGAI